MRGPVVPVTVDIKGCGLMKIKRIDTLYACPICKSTKWIPAGNVLPVLCDSSISPHITVMHKVVKEYQGHEAVAELYVTREVLVD